MPTWERMSSMLEVSNVTSGYGSIQVLHDVSLRVEKGEIISLIGANGAGKTTLLKTISGILRCKAGTIQFNNESINRLSPSERVKLGISLIPEGRGIFVDMSVYENLLMGAYCRSDTDQVRNDIEGIFQRFPNLGDRKDRPAGVLSGGEQQMLAIGRGLLARPTLLTLDEPSLGLAPLLVREVFVLLTSLHKEGVTILLVEQNAKQALKISGHAYVLATGQIKISGKGSELMENPLVQKVYLGGH